MIDRPLYQEIARCIDLRNYYLKNNCLESVAIYDAELEKISRDYLPSRKDVSLGLRINTELSSIHRIVINLVYRPIDVRAIDFYGVPIPLTIEILPSLLNGIKIQLSGTEDTQVNDYLRGVFYSLLNKHDYSVDENYKYALSLQDKKTQLAFDIHIADPQNVYCNEKRFDSEIQAKRYAAEEMMKLSTTKPLDPLRT